MSAPTSNMIGLYYIPIVTIAHETGMAVEEVEGALETLRSPFEGEPDAFLAYEAASETVFVRTMARRQLGLEPGQCLSPRDKNCKGILRMMKECDNHVLLQAFWNEYHETFHLPEPWWNTVDTTLHVRPSEGPSKPHRSQGQGQGQGQGIPPVVPPLGDDAPEDNPALPGLETGERPKVKPKPRAKKPDHGQERPEFTQVVDHWFATFEHARGAKPPFGGKDGKQVNALLDTFRGDAAAVCQVITNAFSDPWWAKNRASLCELARNPNQFVGENRRAAPRGRQPPPQPGTRTWKGIDPNTLGKAGAA